MSDERRSPLKDKPLRTPGQSALEARHRIWEDKIEEPMMWAMGTSVLALYEVCAWYFGLPRQPLAFALIAVIALAFLAWRVRAFRPKMKALEQGADGEKAVGQFLEGLRSEGYEVFHDVLGPGFNVDHVLIGPSGIFTIETKTWSKPSRGEAKVQFDGETLTAAGLLPDRNPLVQARAQVSWLTELLKESTGHSFPARGVVLFPGWYVEQQQGTTKQVWVLNPKALPEFLKREPVRLPMEEIRLARFHLSRYVRQFEATNGG